MSVLKNFKNTPGRPMGATGPRCNFFFKFATRSMAEKKMKQGPIAKSMRENIGTVIILF